MPDGWKLVPTDPTPEMMAAFWGAMFEEPFTDQYVLVGAGYDAMLAAAPKLNIDAAAKFLAEKVIHYSWDGLRPDGRSAPFPAFKTGGHANARQEDYRDAVRGILSAAGIKLKE